MQEEQAGSLEESHPSQEGAYSGVSWSTFSELLLQGDGARYRGCYIVGGFNGGVGLDS